jgi:hypothetical protein
MNPTGRRQTAKRRPSGPMVPTVAAWIEGAPAGDLVPHRERQVKSIKTGGRDLRDRAGLGKHVVPHTIRNSVATEMRPRRGLRR